MSIFYKYWLLWEIRKERAVVNTTVKIERINPDDFENEELYIEAKENAIQEAYIKATNKTQQASIKKRNER